MEKISQIQEQLNRSFTGEAWHGPAVMELIADLDYQTAANYRLKGVHNIWEIVLHISVWIKLARLALDGKPMPAQLNAEEDWPSIREISAENWASAINMLRAEHDLLVGKLSEFEDSKLTEIVPGRNYTFYFLLHGVVQHNLYHAGQISLLKAAIVRNKE